MEEQFGLPEGLSVMDVITRCKQGQKMEILKQAKYLWVIFLTTACQVQGAHIKNKRLNYFFVSFRPAACQARMQTLQQGRQQLVRMRLRARWWMCFLFFHFLFFFFFFFCVPGGGCFLFFIFLLRFLRARLTFPSIFLFALR